MARVQKWGTSLGIRIPKRIAQQVNLTVGTQIEFNTTGGVLTIRRRRQRRSKLKLAELLAQVNDSNRHGEWVNDPPVGREII